MCLRFVDKRFIAGFKRVLSQLLMLSHFSLPLLLSSPSSSYHLSSLCISLLNPLSVVAVGSLTARIAMLCIVVPLLSLLPVS